MHVRDIFKRSFFHQKCGKKTFQDLASLAVITEGRMLTLGCLLHFIINVLQVRSFVASALERHRAQ